jgi:hypothetical protein
MGTVIENMSAAILTKERNCIKILSAIGTNLSEIFC